MATASVQYTFAALTDIKSSEANKNFQDLVVFLNNQVIHSDASRVFTAVPSGPALDPISDNQFARKAYVDKQKVLARQTLTGNSSAYGDGAVTDFSMAGVTVAADRLYKVCLKSGAFVSATSFWSANFTVSAAVTDNLWRVEALGDGDDQRWAIGSILWEPSAGTYTLGIQLSRASGSGTITFQASSTAKRQFWVEDVGPR